MSTAKQLFFRLQLWTFAVALAGCSRPASETIEAVGPSPTIAPPRALHVSFDSPYRRYEQHESFQDQATMRWEAVAWRGETKQAQAVVWSDRDLEVTGWRVADLAGDRGNIATKHVSIRRIDFVMGDTEARDWDNPFDPRTETVYIADLLRDKTTVDLEPGKVQPFWITIDVPRATPPGRYRGQVTVTASNGDEARLEIDLDVLDLVLPPADEWSFHLDFWQFPANVVFHHNQAHPDDPIELWSERHLAMLEPFYRHLAGSGQKAITTYIKDQAMGADSMVRWLHDPESGAWTYDYRAFDRFVDAMMGWGIDQQINAMSVVGWNKSEIPYINTATGQTQSLDAPIGSPVFAERWNHFLTDFRDHLSEKGWFDRCVLHMDEVPEEEMTHTIDLIKRHDPRWKIGLAWGHQPSDELMASLYDSSGLLGKGEPPKDTSARIVTFYTSCAMPFPNPYVTRQSSPAEMVWMAWHAASRGYDGYLRWAYDYWRQPDPINLHDNAWSAGDFSIVYRSSNDESMRCLSSVRFELLRQGIQDFEKLRILRDRLEPGGDTASLSRIDQMLSKFTAASGLIGGQAQPLVEDATRMLDQVSQETAATTDTR